MQKKEVLEPLADELMKFPKELILQKSPRNILILKKGVESVEDALAGARDILAEQFADDATIRDQLRKLSRREGKIVTAVKNAEKDEKQVFEMYYEYEEPVKRIVPHRILAINRGEKEDVLSVCYYKYQLERAVQMMENRMDTEELHFRRSYSCKRSDCR